LCRTAQEQAEGHCGLGRLAKSPRKSCLPLTFAQIPLGKGIATEKNAFAEEGLKVMLAVVSVMAAIAPEMMFWGKNFMFIESPSIN
jgi:hypothetical protein